MAGITECPVSEAVKNSRDELGWGEKLQKKKDELKRRRRWVRPEIPHSDMHLNASVVSLLSLTSNKDPRVNIAMHLAIKNELDALEEEYSHHCHCIERNFREMRNATVAGLNGSGGVPHFWLSAMLSIGLLRNEITKDDEEALKYLIEIRSVGSCTDPRAGLNFCFVFSSNPFFKNAILSKTFHFVTGLAHQALAERAEGTSIDWVEGKCLTQKCSQKKPRSFFNFFETNDDLETHFLIASAIVEEVVPYAIKFYERMELRGLHIK